MTRLRVFLGSIILGTTTLVACSSEALVDENASSELIGGNVAAGGFPSTMHILDGCTVTKIGERLILTAAHCVGDNNGGIRETYQAGRTLRIDARGDRPGVREVEIARTLLHPQNAHTCSSYCSNSSAETRHQDMPDVAVIEVEGGLEDIPVAEIDLDPTRVGDEVTISGYGCVGDVWSRDADGQLRYLDTRIVPMTTAVHIGGLSSASTEELGLLDTNFNVTPGPSSVPAVADGRAAGDECSPGCIWSAQCAHVTPGEPLVCMTRGAACSADNVCEPTPRAELGAECADGCIWSAQCAHVTPGQALVCMTRGSCSADKLCRPRVEATERAAGLCPGDSGGALFRKGTNRIVGVNASYTFLPGDSVPMTNWHARVDGQSRWGVAAWLESLGAKTSAACAERGCRPSRYGTSPDGE